MKNDSAGEKQDEWQQKKIAYHRYALRASDRIKEKIDWPADTDLNESTDNAGQLYQFAQTSSTGGAYVRSKKKWEMNRFAVARPGKLRDRSLDHNVLASQRRGNLSCYDDARLQIDE